MGIKPTISDAKGTLSTAVQTYLLSINLRYSLTGYYFHRSHMRHMRQMNNMMNSLFSDPFGMLGEGPLSIMGGRRGNALMPYMPQMPSLNRLFAGMPREDMMPCSAATTGKTCLQTIILIMALIELHMLKSVHLQLMFNSILEFIYFIINISSI